MDVKDYSEKLNDARNRFREAQKEIKRSYEKETDTMKEGFGKRIDSQEKLYADQKSKLEEQNEINNNLYNAKTNEALSKRRDEYRDEIKKNTEQFSEDRFKQKKEFDTKLSDLSENYDRNIKSESKVHGEAKTILKDRYDHALKNDHEVNRNDLSKMQERVAELANESKDFKENKLAKMEKAHRKDLDALEGVNREEKFAEVTRLAEENKNIHDSYDEQSRVESKQKEQAIAKITEHKEKELEEGQKNLNELQNIIKNKNNHDQEIERKDFLLEKDQTQKKFANELKNIQRVSNQKAENRTDIEQLKSEKARIAEDFDRKLASIKELNEESIVSSRKKDEDKDVESREKLKELKLSFSEESEKNQRKSIETRDGLLKNLKEKNSSLIDRYKKESAEVKKTGEDKLVDERELGKKLLQKERVSFGNIVNTINEKNIESLSTLKNDFAKDRTSYIEKTKRQLNEERVKMKEEANKELDLKDTLYQSKIANLENDTSKIIDSYESKLEQLQRKNQKEITAILVSEEEKHLKDTEANKRILESEKKDHVLEVNNLRNKYEKIIAKDRSTAEKAFTKIVQKYEDQLEAERFDHGREMASRLRESQSQFEQLFKASEIEKDSIRTQYEERIEKLKQDAESTSAVSKRV